MAKSVHRPVLHFHVGAPKTGTTTIQTSFRLSDKTLRKAGLGMLKRRFLANKGLLQLCDSISGRVVREGPIPAVADVYRRLATQLGKLREMEHVLISHERLLGSYHEFYPKALDCARLLKELATGYDARVILYVRRQDRFVESCYLQSVQMGASHSFDEFLIGHPRLARPDWRELADAAATVFGHDKLTVRPMEATIGEGWEGHARGFLRLIDPALVKAKLEPPEKQNRSFTKEALDIARYANAFLTPEESKRLRFFLQNELHKEREGEMAVLMGFDARGQMMADLAEANRDLFRRYMPDQPEDLYVPN